MTIAIAGEPESKAAGIAQGCGVLTGLFQMVSTGGKSIIAIDLYL
jgi:hypothetical protein